MKNHPFSRSIIAIVIVGSLASFSAYASAPYANNPYNTAAIEDITPQTLISSDSSSDGPQPVDQTKVANQQAVAQANKKTDEAIAKEKLTSGPYISLGAGYGISDLKKGTVDNPNIPLTNDMGFASSSGSVTADGGFSGNAQLGYAFNQYIALETGGYYVGDGQIDQVYGVSGPGSSDLGKSSTSVHSYIIDLLLRGSLPIFNSGFVLSVNGGMGYVITHFNTTYTSTNPNVTTDEFVNTLNLKNSVTNMGMRPMFGAGLNYQLTGGLAVGVNYEDVLGEGSLNSNFSNYIPNMNLFNANLSYQF